jgi:hypothetical protein
MIIEALRNQLYLIGFLPPPAETKLRDSITMTGINRIEDQVVN